MPPIYYKGKSFETCKNGFLIDYQDYCEEWQEYSLRKYNITSPVDIQIKIIKLIREYYIERGEAPLIRYITKTLNILPSDIIRAFPSGLTIPTKIAGLPYSSCKK